MTGVQNQSCGGGREKRIESLDVGMLMTTGEKREGSWYRGKSQTIATGPRSNGKNVYRIKRNCEGIRGSWSSCICNQDARELQCLLRVCIELMATSDVAETGQVHVVCALGVVHTDGGPAIRTTEPDVIRRIVVRVDDRWVGRFSCKVLECTLVLSRRLAVDLDHITTVEGCDPISRPLRERNTARDSDIGAGVVDGQLTSGNCLAIVAADLGPLKDVDTVGDP